MMIDICNCLLTWTARSNSLRKTKSVILTNSAVSIFAERHDLNDSPDSGSSIATPLYVTVWLKIFHH